MWLGMGLKTKITTKHRVPAKNMSAKEQRPSQYRSPQSLASCCSSRHKNGDDFERQRLQGKRATLVNRTAFKITPVAFVMRYYALIG